MKNYKSTTFISLITLLFIVTGFSACLNSASQPQDNPPDEQNITIPESNINLAQPLEISQNPEDVALAKKIDEIIEKSEFANARWGVFAVSLKDGRVVCARDGRKLFNPASIEKLLTSIVALDKLGADFRWKTKGLGEKQIEDGTLNGNLILYGTGAPDFDENALERLADALKNEGLKHIKGNVIGDDSYFKGDLIGDGWAWGELQWYYGAQASALTFELNQAKVSFENGKSKVEPETDYVQVSTNIKPPQNGEIDSIGLKRGLEDNQVYLYGQGNSLNKARVAVNNPALWAAKNLKSALEKRGVKVEGEARSTDWKTIDKQDVTNFVELATVDSQTLGEIVRKMNKDSVNLYAELILRTIGKKFGETAPDENPRVTKVRGDDLAGTAVIKKWLNDNNIATDEVEIHDGSGLSRLDVVTPEVFGRALIYAAQSKFAETFKNSLPIAGTDGTLRGRLGNVRGKILAKTGSIMYVNSLAGYAKNSKNETFAFVIITNNGTRKNDNSSVIDAIATQFTQN